MEPIYLDHNATTPLRSEVIAEMTRCLTTVSANPASAHCPGRQAHQLLEEARKGVAELIGANISPPSPDRIIFTSGGAEANNLAILGIARASQAAHGHPGHIVISSLEHASVVGPVERLLDENWQVDSLPAGRDGRLRHELLASLIRPDTRLVTASLANHETGVVQPLAEIAAVCRAAGIPLHSDAVQMAGKLPLDFHSLGAAAMSISAHKFSGPPGAGALVLRAGTDLQPLFYGGEQQFGLRPGTESIALARGLWTALKLACTEQEENAARLQNLRNRFERGLRSRLANIEIHGHDSPRIPNTAIIAFPGIDAATLFHALDAAGIACSIGSACTSGSAAPSPTLLAMGIPTETVKSSLRFSFGRTTTQDEVDEAIGRISAVCANIIPQQKHD